MTSKKEVNNKKLTGAEKAIKRKKDNEEIQKKFQEQMKARPKPSRTVLLEEEIERYKKLTPPEYMKWEKVMEGIKALLEINENDALRRWECELTEAKDAAKGTGKSDVNLLAACDKLIRTFGEDLIDRKGINYFLKLVVKNREFGRIFFENTREIYFLREVVKQLMTSHDYDNMQYLFSITSKNERYQNTFAEIVLEVIRSSTKKKVRFMVDNSLEYIEMDDDLYDFFLSSSEKYLNGLQKSRFDTNVIYKFEIAKRSLANYRVAL